MKKYRLTVNLLRNSLYDAYYETKDQGVDLYNPSNIIHMMELVSKSNSYRKLQELACNQELTPRQQAREKRLEREITELAAKLNTKVEFNGDPRGHCVYLKKPGSKTFYNTWGGLDTGYGISN